MFDRAKRTGEANTFDMNRNTGITTWTDKHGNTVVTDRYGNMISESSASASRADSASSANSQKTVKCLVFCLGISTANSSSAANSDSRTNSPGSTVTAQPVEPRTSTAAAPDFSNPPPLSILFPSTPKPNSFDKNNALTVSPVQCIDNTGSPGDEGYGQGYTDGQTDFCQQNGFDNSLHSLHTTAYITGYKNGYQAGFDDAQLGVYKNPC